MFSNFSDNEWVKLKNGKTGRIVKTTRGLVKLIDANPLMIKIFYPKKKWLTSNKKKPYAIRFVHNCQALNTLNIAAPDVTRLAYYEAEKAYLVFYKKMAGENLRELCEQGKFDLKQLASFIAELHYKGVFFRSIHLENIVYHEGRYHLIDVADVKFYSRPLSLILRYRNLKHLFSAKEDLKAWQKINRADFLANYFRHAASSSLQKKLLFFALKVKNLP